MALANDATSVMKANITEVQTLQEDKLDKPAIQVKPQVAPNILLLHTPVLWMKCVIGAKELDDIFLWV